MHRLLLFIISTAPLILLGTCKSINRVSALARIKKGKGPYIVNNSSVAASFLNTTTNIFRHCGEEEVVLSSLPYLEEKTDTTLRESLSPCGEDCVGLLEWSPCNNAKVNIPSFATEITMNNFAERYCSARPEISGTVHLCSQGYIRSKAYQ